MNTGRARHKVGAFAALCGIGIAAHAQEALPPGITASFDVTQRLEYSDNPDLDIEGDPDFFGRTILGFNLESATSLQNFSLGLGTDIEEGRNDKSSVDLTNTFLRLGYDRATRNASIGTSLRYRESDATTTFFDDDFDNDSNAIDQDTGTRQNYGFGLIGAIGVEAPIGASFDVDYSEVRYSGTDDPDLTDQSTLDTSAQVSFRIDPRIIPRLTAKYFNFDARGDGTNRETTGFGAGVLLEFSPLLTGDFEATYDSIERTGDEVATDDGVSFSAELTRDLTNGTLGARLSSEVSSNGDGRRGFFTVNRDMDLSRRAALSYSLGGTRSENSSFEPLVDVDYVYALPTSQISFGLSQQFNTNSDNEEQINTTLNAGYQHQVNSLSSIGADFSLFDRNELGPQADDGRRVDFSLSYQYALTRDWGLVSGVSHILSTSDSEEDRSSNTIFVGLQRNFSWNP
ncbi:hypothetical protein [Roseobacter sp. OBYS 0001]|uniref:hypothetical protein n=1 Tax=Roseobacter sp. OBYS 0001 TaxID=882651 RepID=UPI001BBB1EF6|nr:hypothetical protein [Roseobacter sp. OBYS 0001]GIT89280.1 hypothetical protein ROBYS_42960 [Roseobacter sp. OBYS 0001]